MTSDDGRVRVTKISIVIANKSILKKKILKIIKKQIFLGDFANLSDIDCQAPVSTTIILLLLL